jgi:hypothetical protein
MHLYFGGACTSRRRLSAVDPDQPHNSGYFLGSIGGTDL